MKTKKELIIEVCAKGATYKEIRSHINDHVDPGYLYKLIKNGTLFKAGKATNYVYFTNEKDAKNYVPVTVLKSKSNIDRNTIKPRNITVSLSPTAKVTWPDHVKVQICPTFTDNRFKFTPPSNQWVGEITKDRFAYWADK